MKIFENYSRFFITLLIFLSCIAANAQKKDISTAKTYIKSGKDYDKAEQLMQKLLKDSTNRQNTTIWDVLFESVLKQYKVVNQQIYLKQNADTTKLFSNALKMFQIYEAFDSMDAKPNTKGISQPKYRKKHAEFLLEYRRNLYGGGMYYVKKKNFAEAYKLYDAYIDCAYQPLFEDQKLIEQDPYIHKAAYMALYSAFRISDVKKTLKYAELAMRDTANMNNKLQYLSETFFAMRDTDKYVATLEQGFANYPKVMYYYPRLFNYYFNIKHDVAKSEQVCNKALAADSTNVVFLSTKSSLLLNKEDFDGCVKICDRLIARNDSLTDAYLNAGLAFYNQAVKIENNIKLQRKQRSQQLQLYKRALPYLQRYRALAPNEKEKWGIPLYTVYLNLNMGKEFDEIEKILKTENGKK